MPPYQFPQFHPQGSVHFFPRTPLAKCTSTGRLSKGKLVIEPLLTKRSSARDSGQKSKTRRYRQKYPRKDRMAPVSPSLLVLVIHPTRFFRASPTTSCNTSPI